MPIDKISDIRRFPRLGKIRLGIKKEGQKGPYPSPTDYFVCPEEVKVVHGEHPKELPVMFPSDDLELIAPQYYKCYSYSQGLICRGNGKTCRRKVDIDTGDFANRDTRQWDMADGNCNPDECPMLATKQCRKVMSLQFILPEVPGLGVYQLDTSSFYSIVNMNSQLAPDGFLRPFTRGRIAFIPLILSIGPQEVTPPGVGRKTVQILKLRADVKLADIIRISRQKPYQVLLPTLEEEEPPDDLFPGEIIGGPEETAVTVIEEPVSGTPTPEAAYDRHFTPSEKPEPPNKETTKANRKPRKSNKEPDKGPEREPFAEHDTPESNACHCPKPVPAEEVIQEQGGSCYHRSCGGYICTPPIDCYPGCPHIPLEGEGGAATAKGEDKTGEPAKLTNETAGEPEGEGFHIDMTWLNETLKLINWSEDTAKTWLTSHFQVSPQGKLTEVLQRLTREQAKEFVNELNDRAAKVQPQLFD